LNIHSIQECLYSEDPLSESNIDLIVDHAEEDGLVDYKLTFDSSAKQWLGITKDIMAFANTCGGYLVFGVRDKIFDVIGLEPDTIEPLLDVNLFQQKVNSCIEPDITGLRSKKAEKDGNILVVMFIPPSSGRTHVFKKDGKYKYQNSKKEKTAFLSGTLYVRRSGANHLADSRDLDEIFERRMTSYKDQIMERISRVVEAPSDKHVLLVSEEDAADGAQKFVIDDAPDSIAVRGMAFSVTPSTPAQEVASWIALRKGDESIVPPRKVLWSWYRKRHEMALSEQQSAAVASFCLKRDVPCFYWLQGCVAKQVRDIIADILRQDAEIGIMSRAVTMSMFLGVRAHAALLKKLEAGLEKLDVKNKTIPTTGPRERFNPGIVDSIRASRGRKEKKETAAAFRKRVELELDKIIDEIPDKSKEPRAVKRTKARALDCFLYAREDRYAKRRS